MTTWLYKRTNQQGDPLWTVGFYDPNGDWQSESDQSSPKAAAERVHYLNGGNCDVMLGPFPLEMSLELEMDPPKQNTPDTEELTLAQKLGHKEGDRFIALEASIFNPGSIVELYKDDGSDAPLFKVVHGRCPYNHANGQPGTFELFKHLKPFPTEAETENPKRNEV